VSGIWMISYVLLWVLFLALVIAMVGVLRNLWSVYDALKPARTSARVSSLTMGQTLPDVSLTSLAGDRRGIGDYAGTRRSFAIVSAHCGACGEYLQRLAAGAAQSGPDDFTDARLVIISLADRDETAALLQKAGCADRFEVLLDPAQEVVRKWGVVVTPCALIADEKLQLVRQVLVTGGEMAEAHHPPDGKEPLREHKRMSSLLDDVVPISITPK
jgi:hypothetical protein